MDNKFGQLSPFTRVDLHIHTIESQYKDDKIVAESDAAHIDVILEKLNENNINLFSFADHNRFNFDIYEKAIEIIDSDYGKETYPNVKNILSSAEFDVYIDPGKPDCHILTIFDANTSSERKKIKDEIEKDKLIKNDDAYTLDRYVKLLRNIGLSTILIACQRKALENNVPDKTNSISDSCDDVYEFLKTGFISALEYQKPNVEGILINSLSILDESIRPALVANSDCHEWAAYPNHDRHHKQKNKVWFFEMKSQPSFMGLLLAITSPQTRFKRESVTIPYIKYFMFNGEKHELSSGFNAIIGENGSGKSTLLSIISPNPSDSSANYIKSIKKDNGIHVQENEAFVGKTKYIKQGDLVKLDNKDELFSQDVSFPNVDNTVFIKSVNSYKDSLLKIIKANINFNNQIGSLKEKTFTFVDEYEDASPFYVIVTIRDDFANGENKFKDQFKELSLVYKNIENLILSDKYSDKQKEHFKIALQEIGAVKQEISIKYFELEYVNSIKNIIVNAVNDYLSTIKTVSSSFDAKVTSYNRSKQAFVDSIVGTVKSLTSKNGLTLPKKIEKGKGYESVEKQGFMFVSTVAYHETDNLKAAFLENVFNAAYQSESCLTSIDSESAIRFAISNCGANGDYVAKLDENVNKFITAQTKIAKSVLEISTSNKTGGTLGEHALAYYKFITNNDSPSKVFLIDQPEDNISVPAIMKKLIEYLNNVRDKKQIIFVTHNPLLVINLDVDNVIFLNKDNDTIDCISGCLESKGILDYVEKNLDGGKEALRKRLKVYE